MMIKIAKRDDLKDVLTLYKYLFPNEDYSNIDMFMEKWDEIINDEKIKCLILYSDNIAVATCIITIIPNLTRGLKYYSVIENVVTHEGYRNKGFGRTIMDEAIKISKEHNCYKVMLMSNYKRVDAHKFYERIGFDSISKKAFQYRISN